MTAVVAMALVLGAGAAAVAVERRLAGGGAAESVGQLPPRLPRSHQALTAPTSTPPPAPDSTPVTRPPTTPPRTTTPPPTSSSPASAPTTAPTTSVPPPPSGQPLSGKTIVIDPGHQLGNSTHLAEIDKLVNAGGFMKPCNTTGTATNGGFPEATFNWDVAVALRSQLEAEGARVVMTRNANSTSLWGPCVDARGQLGNEVHADALISIHGDGADSQYRGFFVIEPGYLRGWTDDIYDSSKQFGADVHAGLVGAGAVVANDYGGTGYSVRTDLGTLNWSDIPAVMVELGNMRNATDAEHMTSSTYRSDVYARGLASGITTYLGG